VQNVRKVPLRRSCKFNELKVRCGLFSRKTRGFLVAGRSGAFCPLERFSLGIPTKFLLVDSLKIASNRRPGQSSITLRQIPITHSNNRLEVFDIL
jgi:hypothetical protein